MFELFDKVRIVSTGLIGTIVDIYGLEADQIYVVESDEKYPGTAISGYGSEWPIFDCQAKDLEPA